jgi:thioredoxin reductase (NADPH)
MVVEGPKPGGLLMNTTDVHNWPGKKSILGPDIIKELREQTEGVGAQIISDIVEKVNFDRWPYEIQLMDGGTIGALSVVIATGSSPRKLGVPGEEEYWGRGVTTCAVCDAHFYKGLDVVVIGGGDSAVEEALQLTNHAKSITILVRKGNMRAAASMQSRLKEHASIKIMYDVDIESIVGDGNHVTAVKLKDTKTGTVSEMLTSGVFLAIGHTPNSQLFTPFVTVDQSGYIVTVGKTQRTSKPGISAAGEVEDHRYRQAGASFGDGSKAGLDVLDFLRRVGFNPAIAQQLAARGVLWRHKETK